MEKEQIKKENIFRKPWLQSLIAMVVIFGLLTVFLLWQSDRNTVSVENSFLEAPVINLSPSTPGVLNELYVKEGDQILPNSQIALVGSEIIYTKNGGIVASAPQVVGTYFNPGQTVVSVVDDQNMEVVGAVDETKGLKDVQAGQRATFTVDAFPGKKYEGIVDEVSPTANNTSVVFSISDERPVENFNVKVRFNVNQYPELKNGMSAKLWIYK
jgi:multidrug resistance efflux pump